MNSASSSSVAVAFAVVVIFSCAGLDFAPPNLLRPRGGTIDFARRGDRTTPARRWIWPDTTATTNFVEHSTRSNTKKTTSGRMTTTTTAPKRKKPSTNATSTSTSPNRSTAATSDLSPPYLVSETPKPTRTSSTVPAAEHADAVVFLKRRPYSNVGASAKPSVVGEPRQSSRMTTSAPPTKVTAAGGKITSAPAGFGATDAKNKTYSDGATAAQNVTSPTAALPADPNMKNSNVTQDFIEHRDIINSPDFKCKDDEKRDLEGKCRVVL